jgi:integrase
MAKEKNLVWRSGREGIGYYADFSIGRNRYRPFLGTDLKAAKIELGRVRAEKYEDQRFDNASFSKFADEFLETHSKRKKSEASDRIYVENLKRFFKGKRLAEITSWDVERYQAARKEEAKTRTRDRDPEAKVSGATVNREISCLHTILSKAKKAKKVKENAADGIRKFHEIMRTRYLVNGEEERLIEASVPHLRDIIRLILNTGLRRGEAFKLKWSDVHFDDPVPSIFIRESKSGRSRMIPMNAVAFDLLSRLREAANGNAFVLNGIRDVKRSFNTAKEKAEIKDLHLHDLRHTFASRLIQQGVPLPVVSKLLGHASITMTMRYVHCTEEDYVKAVKSLEKYAEKATSAVFVPASSAAAIS